MIAIKCIEEMEPSKPHRDPSFVGPSQDITGPFENVNSCNAGSCVGS